MLERVAGAIAWSCFPLLERGFERGGRVDSAREDVSGGGEVLPSGSLQEVWQGFSGVRGAG